MKKIILVFLIAIPIMAQQTRFATKEELTDTTTMLKDSLSTLSSGVKKLSMYEGDTDSAKFYAFLQEVSSTGVLYIPVGDTAELATSTIPATVMIICPHTAYIDGNVTFNGFLNAGNYKVFLGTPVLTGMQNLIKYDAWTDDGAGSSHPGFRKYAEFRAVSAGTDYNPTYGATGENVFSSDTVWIDEEFGFTGLSVAISNDTIIVTSSADELDYAIKVLCNQVVSGSHSSKDTLYVVPQSSSWGVLSGEIWIRH